MFNTLHFRTLSYIAKAKLNGKASYLDVYINKQSENFYNTRNVKQRTDEVKNDHKN